MIKKILTVLAVLAALLALGVGGMMAFGTARLDANFQLEAERLEIPADAATITEGERLVAINQCTMCHGENLGGTDFAASDAFMHLPAPNLTRGAGGLAGHLTASQWEHAIRHGVGQDGRALIIMPSLMFASMTDADVAAIVAYAEAAPPVDSKLTERRYGPIIRLVAAFKADDLMSARIIEHSPSHRSELAAGDTAGLGRYLSQTCTVCHRSDLAGGPLDFAPEIFSANLTPDPETGLGTWSLADFTRMLREGLRPDGTAVDENVMPWRGYARFTDEEVAALWGHLTSLPPIRRPAN